MIVFQWSLSDSKSPQVSRTFLSILAVLNNVVVWMVSLLLLLLLLVVVVVVNFKQNLYRVTKWPMKNDVTKSQYCFVILLRLICHFVILYL